MKITSRRIATEENQGQIILEIGGSTVATFSNGTVAFAVSATDQGGVGRLVGITGGTYAVTAASAATAGSTSALTAFVIPHTLGVLPTNFNVAAADAETAGVFLLGTYVTATSSDVSLNSIAAFTASAPYSLQWWATP